MHTSPRQFLQENVMKFALIVVTVFAVLVLADISTHRWGSHKFNHTSPIATTELPNLLSMGPDPGGHTGATVTPETTKTGQPAVDGARAAASGGKTESSGPSVTSSEKSKK
jgi:hypothetical protein